MSCNRNRWSAPAIDVINTYYGRGDIPIGSSRTGPDAEKWYHKRVPEFPHDLAAGSDAPDAVALYRKILAAQPDKSVTIVTVGWLTNMADLLSSGPDRHSPYSGRDLVAAKVKELVSMGGRWPNTPGQGDYNFRMDGPAAQKVASGWPTPIMFSGLGIDVMTGARLLAQGPGDNPVRAFYEGFLKTNNVPARSSWDHIAVLYAVRGLGDYFAATTGGQCVAQKDGSNQWRSTPNKNHGYLKYKMPQARLAQVIEDLMLSPPQCPR